VCNAASIRSISAGGTSEGVCMPNARQTIGDNDERLQTRVLGQL
jgi:hypothetical protein